MEKRSFTCNEDGLIAAQAFLESVLPLPQPAIVLDEIASNIVRCSGAPSFEIGLERGSEGLTMVFSDAGCPFDPTRDAPEPDVTAPVAERGIGGLGLFMVRKMSKSLSYERRDGLNILRIVI